MVIEYHSVRDNMKSFPANLQLVLYKISEVLWIL